MRWSKVSNFLGRQRQKQRTTREESRASTTIIVPLYIYPEPGAWKLLHESSIQQNESTRFIVIVNPGNGPGPEAVPDANYLSEIPKLTAYSNVDVVGYVHTTFARRPLSMVMNDITTYSNWAAQTQYPGLAINGIFVDETPNQYDTRTERYLADLTEFAKTCGGFGGDKLIIHNPGCVPSHAYMMLADITVVFEDTWHTFHNRHQDEVFDLHNIFEGTEFPPGMSGREKLAIMIHSAPKDLDAEQAKALVLLAKYAADIMFITDLDVNYYANWSPRWMDWVQLIVADAK